LHALIAELDRRRDIDRIKVWARSLIDANLKGQVGVYVRRLYWLQSLL